MSDFGKAETLSCGGGNLAIAQSYSKDEDPELYSQRQPRLIDELS